MSLTETLSTPYALVFPGQGSQNVGMMAGLVEASPIARETVAAASASLGYDLLALMTTGPEEALADTARSQPAIFTASIAALRVLQEAAGAPLTPAMVAGHSLGEFSALVAAGVLDFADGLELVRQRGAFMKQAGEIAPGGMAAVLGLDEAVIRGLVEEHAGGQVLTVANLNCPGQIVVSGEVKPLERCIEAAKAAGARRVARLPISIASHSSLMATAAEQLNAAIDQLELRDPAVPVVANSTAQPLTTASDVREELRTHVERGVDWTGTIQTMVNHGIMTFIELGPGAVLAGLNRRIDKATRTCSLADLTGLSV